jgi:hypothetical protein
MAASVAVVMGTAASVTTASAGSPPRGQAASNLPCDIYGNDRTPCVAAYSMGRALYATYDGPLYQVQRASDGATANVGLLSAGGYVDASEQNSFCAGTTCTIVKIYDQSPEGNDLKNGGNSGSNMRTFELQGGNAQAGGLMTYWNGSLPSKYTMHQEGSVVLGTGGDNSNHDVGSFFEGVMTNGYPTAAADAAVQTSIVAAHYAGDSGGPGPAPTAGPAVVHDGYSSVYTVDASDGDLQETYLPAMGDPWKTQDLSANYGTPQVAEGAAPTALYHAGNTSAG